MKKSDHDTDSRHIGCENICVCAQCVVMSDWGPVYVGKVLARRSS
jgi:hypothetical protein